MALTCTGNRIHMKVPYGCWFFLAKGTVRALISIVVLSQYDYDSYTMIILYVDRSLECMYFSSIDLSLYLSKDISMHLSIYHLSIYPSIYASILFLGSGIFVNVGRSLVLKTNYRSTEVNLIVNDYTAFQHFLRLYSLSTLSMIIHPFNIFYDYTPFQHFLRLYSLSTLSMIIHPFNIVYDYLQPYNIVYDCIAIHHCL